MNSSSGSFSCDCGDVAVTLETFGTAGPVKHINVGNGSVQFPSPVSIADLGIQVVLTFDTPVTNPRLLVRDLDEWVNSYAMPEEYLNNFSSLPSSVGAGFNLIGGTVDSNTDPLIIENNVTDWLNWTGSFTTISFTFNRPIPGYGLALDALEFECPGAHCTCSQTINLNSSSPFADYNGVETFPIEINSNGELTSELYISLPTHTSLANEECFDCPNSLQRMRMTNLFNAPSINGVMPEYVTGSSQTGSSIIKYTFPTPQNLQGSYNFSAQFPNVAELNCCKNRVHFCILVQFKDEDCHSCDVFACNYQKENKSNRSAVKSPNNQSHQAFDLTKDGFPQEMSNSEILVYPNPTSDILKVQVKRSFSHLSLEVRTSSGDVLMSSDIKDEFFEIQLTDYASGIYVISFMENGELVNEQRVIKN